MLKILFILLTFFLFEDCWSLGFERKIYWNNENISGSANPMRFDGCTFQDQSGLPYWIENVPVKSTQTKIYIHDTVFEIVPDSIIKTSAQFIGDTLKYETEYGLFQGQPILRLSVFPFIRQNGSFKKLVAFSFSAEENIVRNKSAKVDYVWKNKSVFSSGKWIKIKTKERGVFKITYDQLKQWGFSDPAQVALYGTVGYMLSEQNNDILWDDPIPYPVIKGKDGSGKDCFFFYSTGNTKTSIDSKTGLMSHKQNCYSTETYFYLTDQGNGKIIGKSAEINLNADRQLTSFNNYSYYEKEATNLLSSGRRWFGEKFNPGQTQTISLNLENPDISKPAKYRVAAVGRSSLTSILSIFIDGTLTHNVEFYPVPITSTESDFAADKIDTFSTKNSAKTLQLKLTYNASTNTSNAWLDFISVNYKSTLNMDGDVLQFRGKGAEGTANVSEYVLNVKSSETRIIDITDIFNATEMPVIFSGNQAKFKSNSPDYCEYVAFVPTGSIPTPEKVGEITNQNLHGNSIPDMIIVTNPKLKEAANAIASFHTINDNMIVEVITPELIYNEFSGGMPDPSGLRNYFKMYYDRGKTSGDKKLKYVLFMGDGSYDNRNLLGNNHNLLPTFQSENSINPTETFVTDDFFGFLDEGEGGSQGIVDLGIGRIPANTIEEALDFVSKIQNYHKPVTMGNWRNTVTFIADDGNSTDGYTNLHAIQAEQLATDVNTKHPAFFTDKIYFDSYKRYVTASGEKYPDVNAAIAARIKQGTLVMNYTGHANERSLADETVMDISSIRSLSNFNKLPIFVTATCEFSRFDANETSAGEEILFNPNGGGIGLFSTTRLVYSDGNFVLNQKFFDYIFEKDNEGNNLRLGDVMQKAKANANTGTNQLNFTLLADPAMRLANPGLQVKTSMINGKPVGTQNDTIRPLSVVTVKGYIADFTGAKVNSFDGEIIPSVYDKVQSVKTLGNAGQQPMSYNVQTNLIYKGLATVKNGEFEFSFIVPKEVATKFDNGKITYYAYSESADAQGYFDDFLVGGTSTQTITDTKGPDVKLYMNTDRFTDGDEIAPSSVLIADITDDTGINTSGIGIGHDITAVLDGDYTNIMVLNDYFQSDKDAYTKGKIIFPLTGLSEGTHSLKVKVWDVLNNSTEVEIHFVVKNNFRIESVACYPNPVIDRTNFVFTHNYPDETFDVTVEIFNTSGVLLDNFKTNIGSSGNESLPIEWLPSSSKIKMNAGILIFRLNIKAPDGKHGNGSGRLMLIKR